VRHGTHTIYTYGTHNLPKINRFTLYRVDQILCIPCVSLVHIYVAILLRHKGRATSATKTMEV
jgi:hypothetical protein